MTIVRFEGFPWKMGRRPDWADGQTHSASISVRIMSAAVLAPYRLHWGRTLPTFTHEIRPPDAVLNLFLVAQAGVGHEGLVQARPEELVARGVVAAEVEELCVGCARSGWLFSLAFMQGDVARDPRWAERERWKVVGKIQVGQGRAGQDG